MENQKKTQEEETKKKNADQQSSAPKTNKYTKEEVQFADGEGTKLDKKIDESEKK